MSADLIKKLFGNSLTLEDIAGWTDKPDDFLIKVNRDLPHNKLWSFDRNIMIRTKSGKRATPSDKGNRYVRLGDLRMSLAVEALPPKEKKKIFVWYSIGELRRFGIINDDGESQGLVNASDLCKKLGITHGHLKQKLPFKNGYIPQRDRNGKELKHTW